MQVCPTSYQAFVDHLLQTLDFVLAKKKQFANVKENSRVSMGIWEALEYLVCSTSITPVCPEILYRKDTLVDDSDPDTSMTQIQHCLQTAEAMRKDGQPRWMILTGLIHDLGKVCLRYFFWFFFILFLFFFI